MTTIFEDLMAAASKNMTALRVAQYKRNIKIKAAVRDGKQEVLNNG